MTGTQSPLFRKNPELLAKIVAGVVRPKAEPRVLPQCIFAASRQRFECIVTGYSTVADAQAAMLEALPLDENGWGMGAMKVTLLRIEHGDMTFLVERG